MLPLKWMMISQQFSEKSSDLGQEISVKMDEHACKEVQNEELCCHKQGEACIQVHRGRLESTIIL